MKEQKLYIDDRVIIPDWIKKMTHEEKEALIAQIEGKDYDEIDRIIAEYKKNHAKSA